MKNSKGHLLKVWGLVGILALCLTLTSCVVPPDDIDTSGNYVVTDGDLPFQSVGPSITNTPYVPQVSNTPEATKNWNPSVSLPTPTGTVNPNPFGGTTSTNPPVTSITPNVNVIISTNTATPASTTTLKNGSTGDDVKKMQQRLKELGYLKGSADGDFGDATETAVKAFQLQNGLSVDGKAGANTLSKLYSASAKKAPTTTTTNTPRPTSTPFTSYKNGDTGAEVKRMQQRLKELGYLKGSADGDFGDATEAAVRAFQDENGLTVDGKAGTKTLEKLYSSSAKKAPSNATATPKITATPKPTATPKAESLDYYLELGGSGNKVRTLQNRLIELGWLEGSADGKYGNATEYAVKAFQARYASLWKDGIAGPDTLKTLYGAGAAKAKTPAASLGIALEPGDKGDAVTAMQNRLKELGFFKTTSTGNYGDITKAAVIAFQKANGLNATGEATTATLNKLYAANAKNAATFEDEENAKQEEEEAQDPEDTNVSVNGYTTLRKGSSGQAVRELQQALKNQGYFSTTVTGTYADLTEAAVKAFQERNGLKADGVAGPATQSILFNTGSISSATSTTLKKGSSGTDVRNLQYVLYELGYYDGSVNGEYGDTTADAVRAFQINNSISPVDGVAGTKTLKVIYSSNAIGASAPTGKYTALVKGDKGTLVVELQEKLASLGYLTEVTGVFDNATLEAVKNFQRRNGIATTGNAGQQTQTALYGKDPVPAW